MLCPNMFLLQPLSVLVIILFLTAKSQDGGLVFSSSNNPVFPDQAIMMMSKRGTAQFRNRLYNKKPGRTWFINRLNKPQPHAPAVVPVWCQGHSVASKTIARARRTICPEPSKIEGQRRDNFGMSYGRG